MFLLEDMHADANRTDAFGNTPMQEAAKGNYKAIIDLLASHGGTMKLADPGTILCNATFACDLPLLRNLLAGGVPPDSADYDLRTALHIAAAEGLLPICKLLVSYDADVNFRDRWG